MTSTDVETGTDLEPSVHNVGTAIAKSAEQQALDASARLGTWLAAAESEDKSTQAKAMAAALRIEYARLLGFQPHAAAEVHIIKGNLTLSAKMCRAMAHSAGLRVERVQETSTSCTAAVVRVADGVELGRTTYTMEQAKAEGLLARPGENWKVRPDRMMWARASKRALDDFAPWVTVGVMTTDEADDMGAVPPQPFDSDEVLEGTVEDDA